MKKYIENLFSTRGTDTRGVGFRSVLLLLAVACALAVPRVATAATYQNMGGDRILLMNNDSRAATMGGIASGQGYYDTNTTVGTTYWTHTPNNDNKVPNTLSLLQGSEHILHAPDGMPLWHLVDCRAGNVLMNAATLTSRSVLPWSGKYAQTSPAPSASWMDGTTKITTQDNAAHACVIMRDNYKAAVYSPYYGEGIGTIYFDTVNSFPSSAETIQIQIATNLTEEAILVNESNPSEAVQFEDVHKTVEFEKWDNYYNWQAIPVTYLDLKNGTASMPITTDSTNFVLNVTDKGTNHFFRVRTQLNYYGPIRFRIKRITETVAEQGSDTKNLVLIDNILVSYPPMTIKFHRQGHPYDESLRGSSVLGCIGDFDKPFLTYADTSVNAGINYSWVTNFQANNIQITVNNLKFFYRWRYLDQKVNPWRSVSMTTNKYAAATSPSSVINYMWKPGDTTIAAEQFTNLYTNAGIPLADGVGDLEYFFTANVNAPYYNPRDYVYDIGSFGKMIGSSAAWKEQGGVITNRMEVADDFRTPAMGNDYFTRIREGISDYKWVALCTSVTTNGVDRKSEELRMELVGDHTWRYHYYVPTNMVGETFAFHFKGEQITTNIWVSGYISATNTWYCDLAELPYIPYTSAAGLGYHNDISCKLDPAATHLMIEFNDELLSFSISHASYQNFNAWTDATVGYVGHTNWNGEGAIGVSDTKKKYTLEMLDEEKWKNSVFTSDFWYEPFNTDDYVHYPWDTIFDEHATPNGWTAGHGQFIRSQRGQDEMALQLEGRGQGWVGMDSFSSDMMPNGIDKVEFQARLAQAHRFDDFAWYMDGISYTNYAICARISMGDKGDELHNPEDVSPGNPSLSLVGYYRPSVGCYEFRITRSGQYQLCAALYRWTQGPLGMTATLLCSNAVSLTSDTQYAKPGNLQPSIVNFGNFLCSGKTAQAGYASNAYLYIKRTGSTVELRGVLSKNYDGTQVDQEANFVTLVTYSDSSSSSLKKGTFGVGSTDCNSKFLCITPLEIKGTEVDKTSTDLGYTEGDWAFFSNRWKWDNGPIGLSHAHIRAVIPTNQTIKLEFKAQGDKDGWKPSGYEKIVSSFSTNKVTFTPQVSPSYQVRLRTGGNTYDELRTDLAVDEIRITSWQAGNYPDLMYYNGQYTEWVYMQGVVEKYEGKNALRLQPSRGLPTKAMGLRSPFLANGISMFSCDYAEADKNTRLLLQVCTNLVSYAGVSESLTTYAADETNYWTTVTNWNFSTMTDTVRRKGTLTHYMSFRAPTMGLIRLVEDRSVLQHCIDEEGKSTRNINYGQITITGAYCYDEPALDMRSWYAWNFHTEGWNSTDKRFAYLFDSPDGLSGSLNFSALDADNKTADAESIGLSDRSDIAAYQGNNSFVQCPPMTNGIGSVSFRARTFMTNATTIAAGKGSWVTLYGTFEPDDDQVVSPESWTRIADFYITNTTYQTFQWKTTDDSTQFHAVRLEVAGSRHGRNWTSSASGDAWEKPKAMPMQRVFIDEISVGEPIQPRIVFRNVRPFRSGVVDIPPGVVSNVTDLSEQPLFGESWGLQCTIEPQQMGDELDQDSIKVYAAFKRGIVPWGFENWSNSVGRVLLDRIGDTLTFRSTWNHPESIISPVDTPNSTYPDNVWQYYVWCEFKDKAGNQHRHGLDAVDWTVPSWYFGIKDLNVQYASQGFAGYTMLDTISPKRAWINEVNICDLATSDNSDAKNQFIEIAVPRGADLTAWSLNVLGSGLNRSVIATYGFQDAKIVPNPKSGKNFGIDWTNDYTVVALRSPAAKMAANLPNSDGAWNLLDSSVCNQLQMDSAASAFWYYQTYGIELVRPSGVIEHQIVVEGQNPYVGTLWEEFGSGTNLLAKAKALDGSQSQWVFAGVDTNTYTIGVFKSHGEHESCWTNQLVATPSMLNKFEDGTCQVIDAGWFLQPKGTNVWIYANVYTPTIHQEIGNKTNTTEIFIIRKGDTTNIVYNTEKWWALGKVTTNGVVVAAADGRADRADNHRWVLTLPNVTETLTVDAWGKAGSDVEGMGLAEDDPYFPAIMHWLAAKDDSKGLYRARYLPWTGEKPDDDPVYLGLKDMYWLDIDPTAQGSKAGENAWVFKAGMGGTGSGSDAIQPVTVSEFGRVYTNSRVTVTMMISNTVTKAAHAPDHLLGLEPGSSSIDYDLGSPNWTSVTFKVTAALQRTGDEYAAMRETYYPLRWFVFTPESFDENFTATIDLWDPYSENSPGMFYGWGDFPGVPIYYKWRLDGDPAWYDTAEPLKARSTYSE